MQLTQYQVTCLLEGFKDRRVAWSSSDKASLEAAKKQAEKLASGNGGWTTNVIRDSIRIEARTITYSDWEPIAIEQEN